MTVDVAAELPSDGTILDASAQMFEQARSRLTRARYRASWHFVHGEAFRLSFGTAFDFIHSFRLIRHFEAADHGRIYAEAARVLRSGGLLVFDAVNAVVSRPLREEVPTGSYQHSDALLQPDEIRAEVRAAGLEVASLIGGQYRYPLLTRLQIYVGPRSRLLGRAAMEVVDRLGGGEPLDWVVVCRRT